MPATIRHCLITLGLLGSIAGAQAETPVTIQADADRAVAVYELRTLTVIRARSVEAAADAVTRVGGEVRFRLQSIDAVRAELTNEQIGALQRDARVIRLTIDRGTHVAA